MHENKYHGIYYSVPSFESILYKKTNNIFVSFK